jgi:hypothetical protein
MISNRNWADGSSGTPGELVMAEGGLFYNIRTTLSENALSTLGTTLVHTTSEQLLPSLTASFNSTLPPETKKSMSGVTNKTPLPTDHVYAASEFDTAVLMYRNLAPRNARCVCRTAMVALPPSCTLLTLNSLVSSFALS